MAPTLADKARVFRSLHGAPGTFLVANAWDGGSARVLAGLGFPALATSSGAAAATYGRVDGRITRDEALAHARIVAAAVDCPVSADLEKGFGDSPDVVAETVRLAAEAGLAGCSIEDATRDPSKPLYDLGLATERIAAAAEAARALPFAFTLTARAEGCLHRATVDETLGRLQAFAEAGADVLFAPGLPDLESVRAACSAVTRPVNFMVGMPGQAFTVAELAACGVKRISLASTLYRAAMGGLFDAAREVLGPGTFTYLDRAMPLRQLGGFLRG